MDEKIYFWDEKKKKEHCVTDEKRLYEQLLEICIKYFGKKKRRKKKIALLMTVGTGVGERKTGFHTT